MPLVKNVKFNGQFGVVVPYICQFTLDPKCRKRVNRNQIFLLSDSSCFMEWSLWEVGRLLDTGPSRSSHLDGLQAVLLPVPLRETLFLNVTRLNVCRKCIAVYFPLRAKKICTVKMAKYVTGIVGIILTGYNLQYPVMYEARFRKNGTGYCVIPGKYIPTLDIIDSVLYSIGPFALMSISNFAIVLKFMRAKCESVQNVSTESTNQALVKAANRGTAMLVTVSVTFLILTAPVGVDNALTKVIRLGKIPLYRAFMNSTQYLNHSINGFLYCIVGSRFRRGLYQLFCQKERVRGSFASYSTNNSGNTILTDTSLN